MAMAATVAILVAQPARGWPLVGWWFFTLGLATLTLLVVERAARRFLPLVTLMRLSLLFPDRAPSRFRLALRAMSTRRLRRLAESPKEPADAHAAADLALSLLVALQIHDRRTRGHCERVRALSLLVGEQLGLEQDERDRLEWGALLHDIGKLGVPRRILNKPGAPDDAEWEQIKLHPVDGARIAAPLIAWLGEWAHGIDAHHEHWDGTGYPARLEGREIPMAGRIVAVTDAFETLTSVRSYKPPATVEAARSEIVRSAGRHFDPQVVRAFVAVSLPRMWVGLSPLAWLAQTPVAQALSRAGGAGVARIATGAAEATAVLLLGAGLTGVMPAGGGSDGTAAAGEPGAPTQQIELAVEDEGPPGSDKSAPASAASEPVSLPAGLGAGPDPTAPAPQGSGGDPGPQGGGAPPPPPPPPDPGPPPSDQQRDGGGGQTLPDHVANCLDWAAQGFANQGLCVSSLVPPGG